ncbi:TetR/AcrR family transcriptional regulator [Sphingomonas aracearum]|uniref:TetR/AcrR family transcriptional regulator n=1 Tax=Sphingomonas aracearum TaxID=2283317 RepID=A0A369W0U6_9SPHN|nr:TetR/AcrR family transcriptional regulator [Sphingomonas aracearum]RDE05701.1 TetR/AcrR family transcriptional regulator [Sphingomonas aracearum]
MTAYRHPRQERSRRTFDALLDATGYLLAEVGIERISTNLICERAKVTPPALYRYFDDKYAILFALAERLMRRQNVAMEAWVAEFADQGIEALANNMIVLLQTMSEITGSQPGAIWIMRALRSVPSLTPIRLYSHNFVTDLLTDIFYRYLPQVDRATLRRRTRLSVEMAYSMDEMFKEEEADQNLVLADAAFVFRSMFSFPEYGLCLTPDGSAVVRCHKNDSDS